MSLARKLRPIAGKVRRLASPLPRLVPAADYWKISLLPESVPGKARLLGRELDFSCQMGFKHSVQEIFVDEVYLFRADNEAPRIIDAGANIGLSVLFFKKLYPNSRIIAYEPDPEIFRLLERNVGSLAGVDLREAAAWTEDTELTFYPTGSLAGSTEVDFLEKGEMVTVKAASLRAELSGEPVDFLKIDIEGAENAVLFDIEDELHNVKHLFFEYHSNPAKPQLLGDMLNLVRKAGFRYAINGTHGPWRPFLDEVSTGFDLQLNVFCRRH